MMTFAEFDAEIRMLDGQLSPRKATPLFLPYTRRMNDITGQGDDARRMCQEQVPDAVVRFWRHAYEVYAHLPPGTDVEEILDATELVLRPAARTGGYLPRAPGGTL